MAVSAPVAPDPLMENAESFVKEARRLRSIVEEKETALQQQGSALKSSQAEAVRAKRLVKASAQLHAIPDMAKKLGQSLAELETLPGILDDIAAAHAALAKAIAALPGKVFKTV